LDLFAGIGLFELIFFKKSTCVVILLSWSDSRRSLWSGNFNGFKESKLTFWDNLSVVGSFEITTS